MTYTHVEVEPSDNCPMSANLVFKNLTDPVAVVRIRLYDGVVQGAPFALTGWSSAGGGSPCPAYAVAVEDSGSGGAVLIYGGDLGLRLRPLESEAGWSVADPDQWGETHFVIADMADVDPVP